MLLVTISKQMINLVLQVVHVTGAWYSMASSDTQKIDLLLLFTGHVSIVEPSSSIHGASKMKSKCIVSATYNYTYHTEARNRTHMKQWLVCTTHKTLISWQHVHLLQQQLVNDRLFHTCYIAGRKKRTLTHIIYASSFGANCINTIQTQEICSR